MVRRKDGLQRGGKASAAAAPGRGAGTVTETNEWFSVPRAAEILGVPVTRIFDRIRDGHLRVRFQSAEKGGDERPLVSSDELTQKAWRENPRGTSAARKPRKTEEHAASPTAPDKKNKREKTEPPGKEVTPADRKGGNGSSNLTITNGKALANGTADTNQANTNKADTNKAGTEVAETEEKAANRANRKKTGKAEDMRQTLSSFLKKTVQTGKGIEEELQQESERRGQAEEKLVALERVFEEEHKAAAEAQRAVQTAVEARREVEVELMAERKLARDLEKRQARDRAEREAAEARFQGAKAELGQLEQRLKDAVQDLERTRGALDQAEDRIEHSLKAVYERDVKVAGLDAQIDTAQKMREEGAVYTDRLQGRITRLEDRSEEKEKEIRRLALGLGEARGEIRMLRPPVEDVTTTRRFWRRAAPWFLLLAGSSLSGFVAYGISTAQLSKTAGAITAIAVLAAYFVGQLQSRLQRMP